MSEQAMVVLSTAPDEDTAARLAGLLVEGRLAACVNIVPGTRSVFRWEGKVQNEPEVLLICKTDAHHLERLTETLLREHPYDCPEVVALPVGGGAPEYLGWIARTLAE